MLGFGVKEAAEGIGEAAEKVGEAGDKLFTSKEELRTLENADRANARALQQAAYQQDDKFTKRASYYMAFFWSFVAALYIFLASFIPVADANQQIVNTTLGFLLGTIVGTIITFYYGSSVGSQIKTQQTEGFMKRIFNKNEKK